MTDHVQEASNSVARELLAYAKTVSEEDRQWFFHPMQRDEWVRYFCEWLAAKQRKSAEVRASND